MSYAGMAVCVCMGYIRTQDVTKDLLMLMLLGNIPALNSGPYYQQLWSTTLATMQLQVGLLSLHVVYTV